jgi:hypothetical protein
MEHPQTPDRYQDRITRAEERLRVAVMRMSQAQELVTIAKQRVAVARLALEQGEARPTCPPRIAMRSRRTP